MAARLLVAAAVFFSLTGSSCGGDIRLVAMDVLEDATRLLSIDQAMASKEWRNTDLEGYVGGYSSSAFWFRLKIENAPEKGGVLTVLPSYLDNVLFFVPEWGGGLTDGDIDAPRFVVHRQGDWVPASERSYSWRGFAVPFVPAINGTTDIYVRVQSDSTVLFVPKALDNIDFISVAAIDSIVIISSISAIVVVCIFDMIFYVIYRNKIYLSSVLFAAAIAIYILCRNGYNSLIMEDTPLLASGMTGATASLMIAAAVNFHRHVIRIDGRRGINGAVSRAIVFCGSAGALLALLNSIETLYIVMLISFGMTYIVITSVVSWRSGLMVNGGVIFLGYAIVLPFYMHSAAADFGFIKWHLQPYYVFEVGSLILIAYHAIFAWMDVAEDRAAHLATELRLFKERVMAELAHQAAETHRNWVKILGHELKTPLSVIEASSQNIGKVHKNPETCERVERISAGVKKIDDIVQSLIHAENIRTEIYESRNKTIFSAYDLVRYCLENTEVAAARGDNSDIVVNGDPRTLGIALSKLINNALQHSGMPDSIKVGVERRRLGGREGVAFWVRDAGVSIPPAVQQQMFSQYWRGATSRGHGVGLWAASLVAESHGGTVQYVRRHRFEQNEFSIWLPL